MTTAIDTTLPTPDQLLERHQVWIGLNSFAGRASFWASKVWGLVEPDAGKRRSLLRNDGGGWDHRSRFAGREHQFDSWEQACRAVLATEGGER